MTGPDQEMAAPDPRQEPQPELQSELQRSSSQDPQPAAPVNAAAVAALADAALPGSADAAGWRRLHPLSPLLRGGLVLLVVAGIIFANFRDHFVNLFFADRYDWDSGSQGSGGGDPSAAIAEGDLLDLFDTLAREGLLLLVLGGLLAVIALIILFSWVMWRFSTYRITDEQVEARSGVLFRTHRRAPLKRIQSVNLQRSLPARILGLTKIEIVTAGQDGKVELAYLSYRDAKTVRAQILRRAAAAVAPMAAASSPGGAVPGALSGPALPFNPADPVFGSPEAQGHATAAVGFDGQIYPETTDPLASRAQDFVDVDIDPAAIAASALVKVPVGRLLGSILLSWEAMIFVAVLLGVVVGGAVFSPVIIISVIPLLIIMAGVMFGQFNRGFNFTLSRGADAVRTGSGLTSTLTESIPFGRIHAVEARQPLFWRPFGWWRVRVTTAGHSVAQAGQNAAQNVVLPVGREADVLRVVTTLLPGLGGTEAEYDGLRNGLSGAGVGYLGSGRRAGWLLWWGRSRAGITIDEPLEQHATLRIRRGALTRSLSVMPLVRVQSVQLRRPWLHYLFGLASVQAHTVLGPVRMEMRGISLEQARDVFTELEATMLRIQRAEAPK